MTDFYLGKFDSVKDEIVNREWRKSVDNLISNATNLNLHIQENLAWVKIGLVSLPLRDLKVHHICNLIIP